MSSPAKKNNLILIYTGLGKGKTTAALGLALRAIREKMKVIMVQFVKSEELSGEVRLKKVLPKLEVKCFGCGFIPLKHESTLRLCSGQVKTLKQDVNIAKKGVEYSKQVIKSEKYNVIILDEIFVAYDLKLIRLSNIIDLLREFREKCQGVRVSGCQSVKVSSVRVLVLTGRGSPESLYKYADLVTEMKEIKHPFQKGVMAVKGIDY